MSIISLIYLCFYLSIYLSMEVHHFLCKQKHPGKVYAMSIISHLIFLSIYLSIYLSMEVYMDIEKTCMRDSLLIYLHMIEELIVLSIMRLHHACMFILFIITCREVLLLLHLHDLLLLVRFLGTFIVFFFFFFFEIFIVFLLFLFFFFWMA